ncbi:MAG TPA: GNAT family N-acetyltransferase [Thermoanaerobaculia bacterium]|nr:GNAT family N-acetyltransferase [Thermoanaerobaculia bacterium]
MTIRPATFDDVEALFEVRTSVKENHQSRAELATIGVTPESIAGMLASSSRAWLAEEDGLPVAFAMADAGQATVFAMFVRPAYEGRGLGRALMREAENWLFSEGCPEIWLLTGSEPSLRAHGFYAHLGWHRAGLEDGQIKYLKQRPDRS